MTNVDFVVINYNTLDLLQALYRQLRDMHPEENIIIVDNGSIEDGTAAWYNRLSAPQIIQHEENLGFAKAANIGAEASEAEYICFLNTDVELVDGWLDGALAKFDDPNVVAVQPKLIKPDGKESKYNFPSGAAMVVYHWYFEQAGGYDEAFPFGYEDIAFGGDIDLNGYEWANSEPAILHLGAQSHDETTPAMLEAAREVYEAMQDKVLLHYVGGTKYIFGLPARDLYRSDLIELARRTPESRRWDRERILSTGFYEEVD